MAKRIVSHEGVITSIDAVSTKVEIVSSSACASCKAKGLCGVAESETKVINLPTDPYTVYECGERVQVCMEETMGLKAVWICYMVPLVVLMLAMGAFHLAGCSELMTGLGAIAVVGIYYLVIFLLRGKLANEYVFTINKLYQDA